MKGEVEFDQTSDFPQRRCAGSRPENCEAHDSQRLAHMFSILDNSTGVARSESFAVGLIGTGAYFSAQNATKILEFSS